MNVGQENDEGEKTDEPDRAFFIPELFHHKADEAEIQNSDWKQNRVISYVLG